MRVLKDKKKRQELRADLYRRLANEGVGLPETIKQLRRILSLSQPEFAEKTGISLSALRRIEQGHKSYNLSTLEKILGYFDLKLVVKTL